VSDDLKNKLLTEPEAAVYLGLSNWTVRKWRIEGKLPAIKIGWRSIRYRLTDLEQFLKRNTTRVK